MLLCETKTCKFCKIAQEVGLQWSQQSLLSSCKLSFGITIHTMVNIRGVLSARHAPANLVCICIYPKQIYTGFGCMSLALVVHKSWECWILSISAYWSVITCPDTSAFTAKFESNLCTRHLQVYNRTLVTDIKSQSHGFVCKFQKMSVLWKCSNLAGRSENKARAPWSNAYEWWWRWIYRIYD